MNIMKVCNKINMFKTIRKITFFASIGLFTVLIPFEVKSEPVSCSSILKPGTELKYVVALDNNMVGYGSLTINSNLDTTRWSGTQINLAGGGGRLDLNGTMNGSQFVLFNQAYGETWTGECNRMGIAGKVNGNVTFIFFKRF
jgi:hypothetical protein